jgi:hypothetical protein
MYTRFPFKINKSHCYNKLMGLMGRREERTFSVGVAGHELSLYQLLMQHYESVLCEQISKQKGIPQNQSQQLRTKSRQTGRRGCGAERWTSNSCERERDSHTVTSSSAGSYRGMCSRMYGTISARRAHEEPRRGHRLAALTTHLAAGTLAGRHSRHGLLRRALDGSARLHRCDTLRGGVEAAGSG